MLAEIIVSVVVDGRAIEASRGAILRRGTVFAPLDPFVRRIADRVATGPASTITLSRGSESVVFAVGSPIVRSGIAVEQIPIAPFVRGGEANIPLAVAARALGETVTYDARARVVYVRLGRSPIARMTPFGGYTPPQSPVTFSPTSTPAPRVIVTGIPRPRRTPIVVQPCR